MKTTLKSLLRNARHDERGQVLPMVAVLMIGMLGMVAFVIDVGNIYLGYQELQASTDAAALAGAQGLPDPAALSNASRYSSVTGGKNTYPNLQNVRMVTGFPVAKCLTTLKNEGQACAAPENANAIQVEQSADVPMHFAQLFGTSKVTITTTATASISGGSTALPTNIVVIVDTTASMSTQDADCGSTRISCALAAVDQLLLHLSPCASDLATCSIAGVNATHSVQRVSLFTFPNVTTATAPDDTNCGGSVSIPAYSLPVYDAASYAPTGSSTATYQVTPFQSDYRTSNPATTLNSSSALSGAVGAGKAGCKGMQNPGGDGTYYAGAIYSAQAALNAEAAAYPGSQNVMILLSDGEAQASASKMDKTATGYNTNGTYPSPVNECQQAVTAARYAAGQGTRVYSVAYGSEDSGCSTSSGGTDKSTITPCQTMQQIASESQYFFSDFNQSGSGSTCQSASQPISNLKVIFADIAKSLTVPRLISNSTT